MFTENQENFILDSYLERWDKDEIAEALGVPKHDVEEFINEYEISYPKLVFPQEFENAEKMKTPIVDIGRWMYSKWIQRYSIADISKASGFTQERVSRIINLQKIRNGYHEEGLVWNG